MKTLKMPKGEIPEAGEFAEIVAALKGQDVWGVQPFTVPMRNIIVPLDRWNPRPGPGAPADGVRLLVFEDHHGGWSVADVTPLVSRGAPDIWRLWFREQIPAAEIKIVLEHGTAAEVVSENGVPTTVTITESDVGGLAYMETEWEV